VNSVGGLPENGLLYKKKRSMTLRWSTCITYLHFDYKNHGL